MLQQVNVNEEQEEAARVRLTMDELARAVAQLEARKMAETNVPPDTMTVGEAIEQLSLNATPEELLAEVEAERRREEEEQRRQNAATNIQAQQVMVTPRRRSSRRAPVIVGALLGVSVLMNLRLMASRHAPPPLWAEVAMPATAPPEMTGASPITIEDAVPLNSLQDGQTAFANLDTINQLANGKSSAETFVHTERNRAGTVWNSEWMLIQLNGKWYVRGWATPGDIIVSTNRKYNFLSSNPDSTSGLTTRTVPLDKFKNILDPTFIDESNKARGVFIPE